MVGGFLFVAHYCVFSNIRRTLYMLYFQRWSPIFFHAITLIFVHMKQTNERNCTRVSAFVYLCVFRFQLVDFRKFHLYVLECLWTFYELKPFHVLAKEQSFLFFLLNSPLRCLFFSLFLFFFFFFYFCNFVVHLLRPRILWSISAEFMQSQSA